MMIDSSENVLGISASSFPEDLTNTMDIHKTKPLILIQ